jgi:DNA primase
VCEGITDCWRFKPENSVAVFGIEFKSNQVRQLKKLFKRVFVAFDDEPQAVSKAEKLVMELRFRGIESERIPIIGDPGGLEQSEADAIVKFYMRKIY